MTVVVVVLLCLALNAIFSAAEMAFVSVSRVDLRKLADKGDKRAHTLLLLRLSPERTLSVLQIGITLVGAISAAVGGVGAEESLAPFFETTFKISEQISEVIAVILIVLPITAASVVIGELVPKSLALRHSRRIALLAAPGLYVFDKALAPVVDILEAMTHAIVRLFTRGATTNLPDAPQEETQISIDSLSKTHRQFVINLVNIESKRAKDIMVDWESTITVEIDQPVSEVLTKVVSSGHTRLPVVDAENKVVGLLHTKEFITLVGTGDSHWLSIVRPIIRVDQYDDALKVLRTMQEIRSHLALVIKDEKVLGIATMEDIIEEIIGEISDEDDDGLMKRLLVTRTRRRR